jgi:hypothetical protein
MHISTAILPSLRQVYIFHTELLTQPAAVEQVTIKLYRVEDDTIHESHLVTLLPIAPCTSLAKAMPPTRL